ncbi:MAG TPA: EmrB/QacA family drug resistance transporter, partial [Acetobacteraceae bacterium]|nr:EmrB/QacA family drug resistance transporter [Acetobacteraceae bacterium]
EHATISSAITPFNRALQVGGEISRVLDPFSAKGAALLNSMIEDQASIISYIDDFKFMLLVTIPAILVLVLMRKPEVQETGEREMAVMD